MNDLLRKRLREMEDAQYQSMGKLAELLATTQQLQNQIDRTNKQGQGTTVAETRLVTESQDLQAKLDKMKEENERLKLAETEKKRLESDLDRMKQKHDADTSQLFALQAQNGRRQRELDQLKQQHERNETRLVTENKRLKQELSRIKRYEVRSENRASAESRVEHVRSLSTSTATKVVATEREKELDEKDNDDRDDESYEELYDDGDSVQPPCAKIPRVDGSTKAMVEYLYQCPVQGCTHMFTHFDECDGILPLQADGKYVSDQTFWAGTHLKYFRRRVREHLRHAHVTPQDQWPPAVADY